MKKTEMAVGEVKLPHTERIVLAERGGFEPPVGVLAPTTV